MGVKLEKTATVYTVPEAAKLLGMHVQTMRKAIRDGKIKAATVGRVKKISRAELERYWKAQGGGELFSMSPSKKG